jgi:hypothetical protein
VLQSLSESAFETLIGIWEVLLVNPDQETSDLYYSGYLLAKVFGDIDFNAYFCRGKSKKDDVRELLLQGKGGGWLR